VLRFACYVFAFIGEPFAVYLVRRWNNYHLALMKPYGLEEPDNTTCASSLDKPDSLNQCHLATTAATLEPGQPHSYTYFKGA
jgi:hypothetical protein